MPDKRGEGHPKSPVMTEPWHFTTWLDLFDHWQALVAGVLGFAAGIFTVRYTLLGERRKAQRELDALQKSLAVELRQIIPRALGAGTALRDLARSNHKITARMVDSYARVPVPLVYPAVAGKIGLLDDDAMGVVIIYSLFEVGHSGATSLINSRDPDNISPATVAAAAVPFLAACQQALSVLPKLKTGVPVHDQPDAGLIANIIAATSPAAKS
jgi:hypothetical protein